MSQSKSVHPDILAVVAKITAKRPKTVVDHILQFGFITSEDLKDTYGYNHPPRAVRDVREEGVPLETFKVADKTGRSIAAYRFGNPEDISHHKLGGRVIFSKPFKQLLLARDGSKCSICSQAYEDRYLTIDHRVPYEVAGDATADERRPEAFMLLCGTCQRKKSWSCEQCPNLTTKKEVSACQTCYWASPNAYSHMALTQERRVEVVWKGSEAATYDQLSREAREGGKTVQDFVKERLGKYK